MQLSQLGSIYVHGPYSELAVVSSNAGSTENNTVNRHFPTQYVPLADQYYLCRKIDKKYNQHDQPDDFYTSDFMQKHTRFASFDEFCRQSPWKIHTWSELGRTRRYKLDSYVNKTTTFNSWKEMQTQAALKHIFERYTV